MPSDSLDQHRRELDATYAALDAIREHAHAAAALDRTTWAAIAELRDELRAVTNRVEALTRAVDAASRRGIGAALPVDLDELVVVNLEGEPLPEVVGVYLDTVEDGVRYWASDGRTVAAPVDCVRVMSRRELRETRRKAGRS
jgi:hypothetical protein